jgi:exonuclease I
MPLVFPISDPAVAKLDTMFDGVGVEIIRNADGFKQRLQDASELRKQAFAEPQHFRQMLYSGGFFPARSDQRLFDEFHRAEPEGKLEIISQFSDERARQCGFWLMGSEWPEAMPACERSAFVDARWEHLNADDEDWTTIPSALREIDELLSAEPSGNCDLLEEYKAYLFELKRTGRFD